jgi:hypothetical protein
MRRNRIIDFERPRIGDAPEHFEIVAGRKPLVLNRSGETILDQKIKFAVGEAVVFSTFCWRPSRLWQAEPPAPPD